MSHSIDWSIITDVSNELSVSIFRDGKALESLNSYRIFEAPSSAVSRSPECFTLKMKALRSSRLRYLLTSWMT